MFVFKAGVVGAGTMGAEIAQLIAAAGIPVALRDVDEDRLDVALETARKLTARELDGLVEKQRLTREQADEQLGRTLGLISASTGYEGFADVDIAIEAVPESLELKQAVLAELDAATPGRAVLASNTSSLSISELADATTRPDLVLGLHFFHPASVMRAVEIVEALETSAEALAIASSFAAAIRKSAIRCVDSPGFVVNRVLTAAVGELWHAQEEQGLAIAAVDRALVEAQAAPLGPFVLADRLGLDVVLGVAERLREAYGDRFHVHAPMADLVAAGELGNKTGRGFYEGGEPRSGGAQEFDGAALAERFSLRALHECCLVLEEGIAGAREIDAAMAAAAGLNPPPFAAADAQGIDTVVARFEWAAATYGERFAPPTIMRRLLAQGRTGAAAGQGFYPAARPDAGQDGPIRLESRGEVAIAWIDSPPANSITLEMIDALAAIWRSVVAAGEVRAIVFASANTGLFCAGADIKAFLAMDAAAGQDLLARMDTLLAEFEASPIVTIAAVNGLALGGGCELAMACDFRLAARSASFGQPEIKLGIIPGFGGTQRLPRLIGSARALELCLTGDPIDAFEAWHLGLAHRVVDDQELLDTALHWARGFATRAPVAISEIKQLGASTLAEGIEREQAAFERVFASADAREGITAFIQKRPPRFRGS